MNIKQIIKKVFYDLKNLKFRLRGVKIKKCANIHHSVSFKGCHNIIIGSNVHIEKNSKVYCFEKYGQYTYNPKILIKNNVYCNENLTIFCASFVSIGENCMLGPNVMIVDENHGMDIIGVPFVAQQLFTTEVIIENNCWIGGNTIILPGVHIGENCIIGAGSVVTKNVASNTMVAGNPSRIIKVWDSTYKKWVKYNE